MFLLHVFHSLCVLCPEESFVSLSELTYLQRILHSAGADLEISKGGGGVFFLLLWLAGHSQPHPLSIVFLGGFFRTMRTIEKNPRSASALVTAQN